MNYLDMTKSQIEIFKSSPVSEANLKEKSNLLNQIKIYSLNFKSLPSSKEKQIE